VDGERVHTTFQLAPERGIDHTMALEPALSAKSLRHNIESEMGLAAGPVSRMTLVQVGFIFDMQALGRKSRDQFRRDDVLHAHGALTRFGALKGSAHKKATAGVKVNGRAALICRLSSLEGVIDVPA
jgi:hypothetical protein